MHPDLVRLRPSIAAICQRYGVRRLDVFGSAARAAAFMSVASDADFLIEFAPSTPVDLDVYFSMKSALEVLLERPVDLLESDALRNPYIRASIDSDREVVYAA